jgi:hypothetical protein
MVRRASLLLAALVAACDRPSGARVRAETYAVYAAALDSFAGARAGLAPLAVADHTWPYSLSRSLGGDTSDFIRDIQADAGVGSALLRAYDRANARAAVLCDCFPSERQVRLVPHELRPGVPSPILLSNVAFNADRTRALVSVSQVCGPLCASSHVYLVVRHNGTWRVSRSILSGAA